MSVIVQRPSSGPFFDYLFWIFLLVVGSLLFGTAFHFRNFRENTGLNQSIFTEKIHTQFIVEQKHQIPVQKIKKIDTPKHADVVKKEVVDLSEKPVMAQKLDSEKEMPPVAEQTSKPVRKVYGLRKVYSQGLGAGGSLSDAVIGKLGNTINTEVDTFIATEQELKGIVVPTTTVTQAPQFKKVVKPEYTKEMIDNKLEGVVKVKVLIDIDGKVKKATVLSDIGFNSGRKALEATQGMEFVPAMRGDEPVAVWIIIPIRFVMIS